MVSGAGLAQACVEGVVAMCPANALRHLHIAAHGEATVLCAPFSKGSCLTHHPAHLRVVCSADEGQRRLRKHRQVSREVVTCQEQSLQLRHDLPAADGVACSALSSVKA